MEAQHGDAILPAREMVSNMATIRHAFVFHRFNLNSDVSKVWEDETSPVIASIATLRAVNSSVKIYVLDTEPLLEDWGEFPGLLDFHVIQQPPQIPLAYSGGHPFQARMISRIWDVWAFAQLIPERYIVYADSDIFWLKDPLPLANQPVDRFYGDERGDGFFYFDKHSLDTELFVNTWRGMTLAAIASDELRVKMRISGYHSPMLLCEMPYCYLVRNGMRAGWSPVDRLEHYFPDHADDPISPDARCLHAHSGLFGRDRLKIVRRVVEFNQAVRSVLPSQAARLILDGNKGDVAFLDVGTLKREMV